MVVTAAAGMTSTSPLAVWHVRRAKGGITTVHPIGAKKSQALRQLQREKARPPWPPSPREKRAGGDHLLGRSWRLAWPGSLAPVRVELVVQAPFEGVVVQAHASGARIRRMGLGYVELQFRSPFGFSGIVIRRGAAEAPHFRSAHSPSRPDTLAQEGSSTAKAFLRALAVAFHRSPTSLRWCWTGERQIAVVVSCSHHRDRRTFPRRIPPGSRGRVAGA